MGSRPPPALLTMSFLPPQPQPAGLPSGTIGGRRRRASLGAWRLAALARTPSRLAFSLAALLMSAALLWWAGSLLAVAAGWPLAWALPAGLAHALVFGLGVLPLFTGGLMLAVAPTWLQVGEPRTRAVALPLLLQSLGWLLGAAGFHGSVALAVGGLALAAWGQALLAGRLAVMVLESPAEDRHHARLLTAGLAVAALALWAVAVAVALGRHDVAQATMQAALWGGHGLALLALGHRLAPRFIGARLPVMGAWQARSVLALLAWMMALRAVFEVAQVLAGGALTGGAAVLCAVVEAAGGLLLSWLAWRWGLRYSLGAALRGQCLPAEGAQGEALSAGPARLRLLTMLHLGFAWLGVAFTLGAVSHMVMAMSDGALSLGLAPQHAFAMGFIGSLLMALVTRLSLQHTGRPLVADSWTWALVAVVQMGMVFAVMAALFPAGAGRLYLLAAQFWGLAGVTWTLRMLRWWGRPSLDAQPD